MPSVIATLWSLSMVNQGRMSFGNKVLPGIGPLPDADVQEMPRTDVASVDAIAVESRTQDGSDKTAWPIVHRLFVPHRPAGFSRVPMLCFYPA